MEKGMIEKEMVERILKQLLLKPRELVSGENIANNSGLYGDGKGVTGEGTGKWGDITDIAGNISGIGAGDLSRFVGCMDGIKASVPEMIAILEDAGKVIKQRC